jgi:sulfatase modifying factor 1
MAFIPAGGNVTKPFFIDRTEVTVAAFKRLFPGKRFDLDEPKLPAHKVTFDEARQFAKDVGKQLPTYEQWQRAAFGDRKGEFPWGTADSIQRHCNVGTSGPREVGSFPSGRSKEYLLYDMAGNVWEWLDDEHAIGGGFGKSKLQSNRIPEGWNELVDFLRHKRPSDRVYGTFEDLARQKKYDRYRVKPGMLGEVGFRCVLEF